MDGDDAGRADGVRTRIDPRPHVRGQETGVGGSVKMVAPEADTLPAARGAAGESARANVRNYGVDRRTVERMPP